MLKPGASGTPPAGAGKRKVERMRLCPPGPGKAPLRSRLGEGAPEPLHPAPISAPPPKPRSLLLSPPAPEVTLGEGALEAMTGDAAGKEEAARRWKRRAGSAG